MTPVATRLAAFVLVLAGTFGTAYAVGERLPGHSHTGSDGHTHTHTPGLTVPVVPGATYAGYQLSTDAVQPPTDLLPGSATFHLVAPDGSTVGSYLPVHEADLHVMLLRPDLSDFQHLHPAIGADGSWTVQIPSPGRWHLVFESTPSGQVDPVVVSATVDDAVVVPATPLPAPSDTVAVPTAHGELTVTRDGLNFFVADASGTTPDGLEPYLGAPAHMVAFRDTDLAYLHLHPMGDVPGTYMFQGTLEPGATYRLFLQFGYHGQVLSVAFTVPVPAAEAGA